MPLAYMQERLGEFLHSKLGVPMLEFLNYSQKVPFLETRCNVSNFVVGMVMSGVIASALSYPLVHLYSLIFPDQIPARRTTRNRDVMRKQ